MSENITSCLEIYKYQSNHEFFENLKKWNQTKTWYLLTLFILFWFTHQKRRGKIQTGGNHVHQGLSKVFVFFTYSRWATSDVSAYLIQWQNRKWLTGCILVFSPSTLTFKWHIEQAFLIQDYSNILFSISFRSLVVI